MKSEKKKTELNELEYSKTPSQMSSYAYKHVFLYLHAQTNIRERDRQTDRQTETDTERHRATQRDRCMVGDFGGR